MGGLAGSVAAEPCLWGATLARHTLEERALAAQAGGFATTTIFPHEYVRARAAGVDAEDILATCARHGVRLRTLDPFARWVPRWDPPADSGRSELVSTDPETFFEIARRLHIETMTAIEPFGTAHGPAELARAFGELCDRAADLGILVHLEFTPFSGIPDLATAWAVVSAADRPNGGIVFDTWHYLRGRADAGLLADIPGERIFAVQINDAAAAPRGSLVNDTWHHRMLPGAGELAIVPVLEVLAAKPGIGPPGIEVLSDALWTHSPAEIGRLSGAALAETLRLLPPWGGVG